MRRAARLSMVLRGPSIVDVYLGDLFLAFGEILEFQDLGRGRFVLRLV